MTIEVGFIIVYPIHNKKKIRLPVDNGFVPQIKFGGHIEEQKLFSLRDLSLSLFLSLSLCSSVRIYHGLVWCITHLLSVTQGCAMLLTI